MSKKRVEKTKKSIHVKPVHRRDRRSLSSGLYIRPDRRKLHESGTDDDLRNKLRVRDEHELSESLKAFKQNENERLYDFNDLPASDYQRMYQT